MSEHTPGPWTLDGPSGYADPECGAMVYATHGNGHLVAKIPYDYSPNQRANALLIAAAPDLLEACKYALEFLQTIDEGNCYSASLIEKAIAKATDQLTPTPAREP